MLDRQTDETLVEWVSRWLEQREFMKIAREITNQYQDAAGYESVEEMERRTR